MKLILLILCLQFPLIISAQKAVYFGITTWNDKGTVLPHCDLDFILTNGSKDIKVKTNDQGLVLVSIKVDSVVILQGNCDHYLALVTNLQGFNKVQENDTFFLKLVFKPMITILHGFYDIDFDTTYAIGELANLNDTIIIVTSVDLIKNNQNYTKLKKIRQNQYQLWYWEEERGGIVDPALYKYDLKVRLKKDDNIDLKFGNKKKTYHIRGLQTIYGLSYELISY